MYAYIGRQAIFDANRQAAGYELLYREAGGGNQADIRDGDAATRTVLSDAVAVFGIPRLTGGLRAYINFTRELILGDFARLADPEEVVIEIMERTPMDELLGEKLRELQEDGYVLALDNYTGALRFDRFLPLFEFVKVDFQETSDTTRRALAARLSRDGIRMIAEKLETEEEYQQALDLGFELFQGYYLEKPRKLSKRVPSLAASSYGRLMNELFKPEVDFDVCCQVVQQDVALAYMLLQMAQQAGYAQESVVGEIRSALEAMGAEQLQRWICLALVRQANTSHSDELPKQAYLRGRFIQRLMKYCDDAPDPQDGFLLGMFSMLDQVMGTGMDELLKDLRLRPEIKAALLGEGENVFSDFLQFAIVFEMNDERLVFPDIHLRLEPEEVPMLYEKCLAATEKAFDRLGG